MSKTKTRKTSTHQLIELRLKTSLRRWVRTRRKKELSWQRIANEIFETTGTRVTPVALRNWFPDID